MKISLKWLNDYVDISDYFSRPEELAEVLTRAGLEVEEIANRAKDFNHVVIGKILEKEKHPQADKLSLCKVTTGEGVVHQIVCGAQNHKAMDHVIVALPGALLPGNLSIKKSSIRGVESGGMLCSYKELGQAAESDGIAILPSSAMIGMSYAQFAGFDDITFELKVTANRADCLSHYGLAREISCLLGRDLKKISTEPALSGLSTKTVISLEVKVPDLCPRYTGRYIRNVKIQNSPDWLKKRIESIGLNSINNVVDVTNYVMMDLGQPLHAFDALYIKDKKVIVDRVPSGEKFITLDGAEKKLTGEELGIRDSLHTMCLAGVLGGKNSGVTDATTEIFLESAYFSPMSTRKTSRVHGIETDSAYRFSRGVDPEFTLVALNRATDLILQVAGGEAFSDHYDFYPQPVKKMPITMDIQTISDRLGYSAEENKFVDYMKRLGCQIKDLGGQRFQITPPSFRFDLEADMDLVEEYARLNGYEHIPETLPSISHEPAVNDKTYILHQKTSEWIRSCGYQQVFNFAFVSEDYENKFVGAVENFNSTGLRMSTEKIKIMNPLNVDMNIMRSQLVMGLYRNAVANFHYGNSWGRLYEMGRCFYKVSADISSSGSVGAAPLMNSPYTENNRLSLLAWGNPENLWAAKQKIPLVFEIQSAIEVLLKKLNISAYTWTQSHSQEGPSFLHSGQWAVLVVEGKKVGFAGALHPAFLEEDKMRVPVAIAEVDLDQLLMGQPRPYKIQKISKFPTVERDLALIMNSDQKIGDILKEIRKYVGKTLVELNIFDIYQGENLETGKKSVALRLRLQNQDATLQENQINEIQSKVLDALKKNFNISMR